MAAADSTTYPPLRIKCRRCGTVEDHGVVTKRGRMYPREACNKCRRETRDAERGIWRSMIRRCHASTCKEYSWYGARGISVCQRWRESFDAFLDDMGRRPTREHSIERVDNDKGYGPDNCVWLHRRKQAHNQRSNTLLTFEGETRHLADWARKVGLNHQTLSSRLNSGWTVERALTEPCRGRHGG